MNRRQTLGIMGTLLGALALPRRSYASTARAVSLADLVARSTRVAQALPLERSTRFENFGDMRHIVAYTRLRVDDSFFGDTTESEILVRTLGGHVGNLGEIVHGEAVLAINEACVVFLQRNPDGIEQVTEMAQGHYPLASDSAGDLRLSPSRNLPHLLKRPGAALPQLAGLKLADARALVLGARH
jgi:hypothetical protein